MSSASHQTMSRHRNASMSSAGRSSRKGDMAAAPRDFSSPNALMRYFEPTAATASMFLYGQGNSVVVAHHDSLTIERRFSRHSSEVQLLAVDTQSDVGAGRLVVSYDAEMTAIVWDLMTGDEVARFASYETLTCAAWMRNGNVAFGNTQGNVILFEPTTSEHISARTIDQIAITALAPAADCRTFAIGYQNGSLLIATLQPRFTILHNLSTNRAPSPIVTLSWHASSSRQKADMLAVQTNDGDMRVWSVSKSYNSDDPAKIVRILKKADVYQDGPNWMGWSKNGRIIQFSNNETLSWDVRTKHVTHDDVPTLDHVRGLAVYGPGATLFTLGANNTVQQFDLNMPSLMVNNVQHPANLLPPSPPVSIEEQNEQGVVLIGTESDSGASALIDTIVSESDEEHMSPLARIAQHAEPAYDRYEQDYYGHDSYAQSMSSRSAASSTISKSSVNSGTRGRRAPSVVSRGMTENTYISAGSSLRSSANPPPYGDKDAYSISSVGSASMTSSTRSSRHKPSRLRNEMPRSPEDNKVQDLFKFTRSRLHDIPYKRSANPDYSRLTNDDLRRQMLSTIFGWNKEADDLVRDELSRHPAGSPSRILLSKWLGDIDSDVMTATSENMTSSDWMLLALSGIGGQASQHKLGRAYVQRLLENGDLHAAATIMLGMGDHNDAIEIYVSHRKYMEALILLCLFFPSVWERQAQIIKKWGEFAVQHGQQQLAIRCFACCGQESSEPWASPSAAQVTFQSMHPSIPEILSPPLSPPGTNFGPQRSIAKTSALKLITSFGDQSKKSKFFAGDDGQTPIAVGMTPILESARTPGAGDPTTAVMRPSDRSAFNTPSTALPPSGFGRKRLPSIGELPNPLPSALEGSRAFLVPKQEEAGPSQRPGHARRASTEEPYNPGMSLARAATASPMMMRDNRQLKDAPMPSPSPESFQALLAKGRSSRNGARERKPEGMELQLNSLEAAQNDMTSPEQTGTSARFHWPTRRRGPGSVAGSVASSVTSQSSAGGRSYRSNATGRHRQDYISSLDTANAYKKARSRERSSTRTDDRGARSRENSRTRRTPALPDVYDDRGRSVISRQRTPKPGKQSPTSPIPMSPEDLITLSTPKKYDLLMDDDDAMGAMELDPPTARKSSVIRRTSPKSRMSSRASSRRRASPERRPPALDLRGQSNIHGMSEQQSPTSPVPLSAPHVYGSDDEEDYRAALEAKEAFRKRHNGSASIRDPQSPAVGRHDRSESQRRIKTPALPEPNLAPRQRSVSRTGDLKAIMTERQLKKEAAARELEERRKSLARRPSAPSIPLPEHLSPILDRAPSAFELPQTTYRDPIQRSHTADPTRSSYARTGNRPVIGLPATPKAMRLKFDNTPSEVPKVPSIPASARASPAATGQRSPERVSTSPPEKTLASLTLLPSTVYSPPPRPFIERCMSAPIPDEPMNARRQRGGSMSRKMSTDANASGMRAIDELLIGGAKHARRASRDDQIPPPPPPPPAPPVLHELQHLAIPPPPPPAPMQGLRPTVYGGVTTAGTIEIVMDDDEKPQIPTAAPISDANVPIIAAPAPPSSRNGHRRGRSITETSNSIAGRFSRATERMRSASRGRNESLLARQKSPDSTTSPYESIPAAPPISFNAQAVAAAQQYQYQQQQAQVERHPREVRANYHKQQGSGTGLLESEMI